MKKNLHGKSINDIRRPPHMKTKVVRPKKGGGYNRKKKHKDKSDE